MSQEQQKENFYAVIPVYILQDKELTQTAKLLYGQISALTNKEGYCWASNSYFAELFDCSKDTISRNINLLIKKGYIKGTIEKKNGNLRKLYLTIGKNTDTPIRKNTDTYPQKYGYNNNKKNNISLSKDKERSVSPEELGFIEPKKSNSYLKVIFKYAEAKGIEFRNTKEKQSFIKRNVRTAKLLEGYPLKKVEIWCKILPYLDLKKWTLETIGKYIDEDPLEILEKYRPDDYDEIFRELEQEGILEWTDKGFRIKWS